MRTFKSTLVPAYGRDYFSKKQVQADLDAEKDFVIADFSSPGDGKPINRAGLRALGYDRVVVRFSKLRKSNLFVV
jgi:hypothetical protein